MKIGIVCPYDMAKGGGVQEIVLSQARGLRKRGHKAWIITPRPVSKNEYHDEATIFIGSAADFRLPSKTTVQFSASLAQHVQDMLDEHQFDVLHFHEPWVPMVSLQILTRSKVPNVATFHARIPDNPMIRTMVKASMSYAKSVLKHIDVLCAASYPGAEYVSTLTTDPVRVIPVDIDLTKYTWPKSFDDERMSKTILYVGRLEGRKGVKYLLQAFGQLAKKHPDVSLQILGDGPDRRKLEVLAEDLNLPKTQFLGYCDNDEKLQRFRTADLFCTPAIYGEGFGKVLLEAMACGLPTVAGDNPGYASVMKGLGMLSLVNPKDTGDFARRLELLLYQNELRKLWRQWAKKEVQQYSSERMIDQYEEVFREALAHKT